MGGRKLGLPEYLWIAWPLALGYLGAAGGILGVLAVWGGRRAMLSDRPMSWRYGVSAAMALAAVALTLILDKLID